MTSTPKDVMVGRWEQVFFNELNLLDERHANGKQGPCPICGGKSRFRFDNKGGRGTWYCNHCGAGDGYGLYMQTQHIQKFNDAVKECGEKYGGMRKKPVKQEVNHTPMLNCLWREASGPFLPIMQYLHGRSIMRIPEDVYGSVLRYHPDCPWRHDGLSGRAPAMLARVFNGDGKPATIHRTFLTTDVPQRKMMLPHNGKLAGCYIPLGKPVNYKQGVGEGIETALSVWQMYGIITWATYCADQMERFVVPDNIDKLYIYGDNDSSFTGQSAAYTLAKRSKARRPDLFVDVHYPTERDTDYNDLLRSMDHVPSQSAAQG